jgi:class 3 adenylate cyclase/predicted ATPase
MSAVPVSAAERRQLTIMFCDLVGSTALSSQLDPEDLREILSAYHRCVAETVARFDGFVAKYMGDGVLAYYGYPQAHEDDAERAVRTGLAIIKAAGRLQAPDHLRVRVGIGTGLVVVGDLIGSGEAQERGIVGETPNLVARLQSLAEPDTVVIGSQTRQLLGNLFEYRDLGTVAIKGFAEPVHAYQVIRSSTVEGRFEALHGAALTPLIGREEEIEILLRRWRRAAGGNGQVILISGEAGIGKSRVTATLLERVAGEPHTRLRHFCSPHHTDSALFPIIEHLERAAKFAREDDPPARLAKLSSLLSRTSTGARDAWLIASLLSLPGAEPDPLHEMSPQQRKQKTLKALVRQLESMAQQQPVLMVFEDVHWIDPTSMEVLDRIVERIRHLRVLLIVTFRPEYRPPWTGQSHVTTVTLNRFDESDSAALVGHVAGGQALSPEIVHEIVERADGVPLFVEELTKAVLDTGIQQRAAAQPMSTDSLATQAVPPTLLASLMARLDRLGPDPKEVAQVGAAIGREFSYELLYDVFKRPESELRAALDQLVEAGLAFCRGVPPQATYLFKHALVQEAAYSTLLRDKRQKLHAEVAAALEDRFPDVVEQQPEVLARHYALAGLTEEAVDCWGRAGRQSLSRSAVVEAAAQLRKGLELLRSMPPSLQRQRQELDLQSALGAALVASVGNPAQETGQAYGRARELCEQLGDIATLVPVLGGLATFHQTRAEYPALRGISQELLRVGEQQQHVASQLVGNRSMGLCLFHLGEFLAAREHFERVLTLYVPEAHHTLASVAAFDMRAVALSYIALELFILGYTEQADTWSKQALLWSRSLRHPHNLAFALNYAGFLEMLKGATSAAEALLGELRRLAEEHRFPMWRSSANIMLGYALAARGDTAEGLKLATQGVADRAASGSKYHETFYLNLIAQSFERAGRTEEALEANAGALAAAEETGERWFEAELHRNRGEGLAGCGQLEQAEACFHRARSVAQQQKARMWELRAATNLARLWRKRDRCVEAYELLAPVYGWFGEGFDTLALREAKELLDQQTIRVRP